MSEEYISPLLSRMKKSEDLTLETLAYYVPRIHAARDISDTPFESLDPEAKRNVLVLRRQAEDAKEQILLLGGLKLVKSVAYKEHNRRQAWNSRVPITDIIQEGVAGLLKGLDSYNVHGSHDSATNYLGQWILTEIRRRVEGLEHDFNVPYETIERHRKIRAIRSRLSGELGREPTDEEIVQGAASSSGLYGDPKMGKVDKTRIEVEGATDRRRVINLKHILEEREASARTGMMKTTNPNEENEEIELAGEVITAEMGVAQLDSEEESRSSKRALSNLISAALEALNAGETQQDIIKRKFGLSPYDAEQPLKEICASTNIPRHKVNKTLLAFSSSMTIPGGPFHSLLSQLPLEEIESMELTWLTNLLGEWEGANGKYVPSPDLTAPLRRQATTIPAMRKTEAQTSSKGIIAYFECPYHVTTFSATYMDEDDVPLSKSCPQCSQISPRIV